MLELIANNQTLDIREVNFNLTLKSPLGGGTSGSYVFSFTIPYSSINASIFGFPYRLNRLNTSHIKTPGYIKYNGMHIQEGLWFAKTSTGKSIQLEMLINSGSFSDLIEDKYLIDTMDESFSYPDIIAHAESQITKHYPEITHNFPSISNPEFYGDKNPAFLGIINNFEDDFLVDTTNVNTLVPQLYLLHVVKKIYEFGGYTVKGDPFDDPNFQKALIYNNFALDRLVIAWFSGQIFNTPIGGNTSWVIIWDENIQDPGIHYNNSTGGYTIQAEGNYRSLKRLEHKFENFPPATAEYYYLDLYYGSTLLQQFERVCNPDPSTVYVNTFIHDFNIAFADIGEELTCQFYYLDDNSNRVEGRIIEADWSVTNTDNPEANQYENNIDYKNHVPEFTIKDFLNAFFASVEILPFFDKVNKIVDFKYLSNLLPNKQQTVLLDGLVNDSLTVYANNFKGLSFSFDFQGSDELIKSGFKTPNSFGSIDSFSDLPNPAPIGAVYFIKHLNAYYRRGYDEDTLLFFWEAIGDEHSVFVIDEGKGKVSTKLAPLLMRNITSSNGLTNRYMPSIHAKGTSADFGVSNTFPLRIMFYFGIEHSGTADAYPFAGTTKWRTTGDTFMPISWIWNSIISNYWGSILSWYKRRLRLEFESLVSPKFIAGLNFKNSFRFQESLLLLEEAFTKIKDKRFGITRFKGWTK